MSDPSTSGSAPPGPPPEAPTEGLAAEGFATGRVLGGRYQVKALLGRGGIGEVWLALDLKLRVEVALKALREDLFRDEARRELLRQEVRAAREVVSPNVCRIFDLVEADGRELVSMEHVDGQTLLEVLRDRGPLELKQAQDVASQFLAGLEAIHRAGLVHRDVKPENIMLTRAGRVVLMDFGLARHGAESTGTVAGTPAYMAPEQSAGLPVDARADVYSAGVVLAEMVCPEGVRSLESRQSVWEGVRQQPARLPDTPWAPVLKKAVAREREQRYRSAHTLTRALEEVTLRVEGAEDLDPYPGLAPFTEADATYFFGRELEVERMWRRLDRPHLQAVIGPSGAGKSSFLRAGLLAAAPPGWAHVVFTPGDAPFLALGRALVGELAGDTEAMRALLQPEDPVAVVGAVSRWRIRHGQALVVADQFEELFTLCAPEVQSRFAALLGLLAVEADVHVLLSMRDDFLFHCQAHEALRPVFTELTPLGPPTGGALRRALVQPATKCGYRFEDDRLVEEMLAAVEGERGALPLLAFAAAQLWERRDRSSGLLTRAAATEIGGVGGALARHAEQTLERIGADRLPVVRELFRNLVTAQGTRAVREVDDLLSVFPDRAAAADVLTALVDARLLTSFETPGDEGAAPTRRVEIIHESLLAAWPRLVGWRVQDADGARLRDELRQAARTWRERGRPADRLWTGASYRELQVWRERYPGGLSETEEAFVAAATAHADRLRRSRRLAVTAAITGLLAVVATVSVLWRSSEREARRADASNLLSLGRQALDSYPTAAVAHAAASLERTDSPAARRLALQALWRGPTAFVVNQDPTAQVAFTPDGHWLAQGSCGGPIPVRLTAADGRSEALTVAHQGAPRVGLLMDADSNVFASLGGADSASSLAALWSVPETRPFAEARLGARGLPALVSRDRRLVAVEVGNGKIAVDAVGFDGARERLGTLDLDVEVRRGSEVVAVLVAIASRTGSPIAGSDGHRVVAVEVGPHGLSEPRVVGVQDTLATGLGVDPVGRFVATADAAGTLRLWSLTGSGPPAILQGPPGAGGDPVVSDDGSLLGQPVVEDGALKVWVWRVGDSDPRLLRVVDVGPPWRNTGAFDPVGLQVARSCPDQTTRLCSLRGPADAEPETLRRGELVELTGVAFHPDGTWLATAGVTGVALWPLHRPRPAVISGHRQAVDGVVFGPRGEWLASVSRDGTVRRWPLEGESPAPARVLLEEPNGFLAVDTSSDGERLLVGTALPQVRVLSLRDGARKELVGFTAQTRCVALSVDGRLAVAGGGEGIAGDRVIRVWDTSSGREVKALPQASEVTGLRFAADGHLLGASRDGLERYDLAGDTVETVFPDPVADLAASADGCRVLLVEPLGPGSDAPTRVVFLDLEAGTSTPLDRHGREVDVVAIDPSGTVAITGSRDGVVRVGRVNGEEPHLLLGHSNAVLCLAVDPRGRWVASGSQDRTIRLWPMPDLNVPPLHTLALGRLLETLHAQTNLRVVRDETSDTGWKLETGPFTGWQQTPRW